jgi:hypothetical protein
VYLVPEALLFSLPPGHHEGSSALHHVLLSP